jgi:FkbM family methyltransferase
LNKNLKKILKNIQLYNYALSDTNGDTKLKLPIRTESIFKNNIEELYQLGAASIHSKNKFTNFKEVIVKKKKLDDFKIINKIGFIKIDVEGHEIEVINGAKETITNNKPVLLVEIEERHTQASVIESINYINKLGYNCFYINNKKLVPIDKLENTKLENNYYFIPKN